MDPAQQTALQDDFQRKIKAVKNVAINKLNKGMLILTILFMVIFAIFALLSGWIIRKLFMKKTYASSINKYSSLIGVVMVLLMSLIIYIIIRVFIYKVSSLTEDGIIELGEYITKIITNYGENLMQEFEQSEQQNQPQNPQQIQQQLKYKDRIDEVFNQVANNLRTSPLRGPARDDLMNPFDDLAREIRADNELDDEEATLNLQYLGTKVAESRLIVPQ
jgi:predicted PurR-regulated permease PerM